MLRCDVISVFVFEDSSVMRIGIFLTGMFGLTNTTYISDFRMRQKNPGSAHAMMAVVAFAGTSAFSIAFANFSCTSAARL